jgi:hypothetical protein
MQEVIEEQSQPPNEVAEQTEQEPEEQPAPEPPKSLGSSKEELAAALKNFTAKTLEVEKLEKRLSESDKEEEELLNSSTLSEEQQVEKLARLGHEKGFWNASSSTDGARSRTRRRNYSTPSKRLSDRSTKSCPICAVRGKPSTWRRSSALLTMSSGRGLNNTPLPLCDFAPIW